MTIASLKRKYPRLIHQAQHSLRLKFKKNPTLRISPSGVPRGEGSRVYDKHGTIIKVVSARVTIPRRMARDNAKLAELMVLHELRESLLCQNGYPQNRAHRKACKREKGDRKRLGLKKNSGWLLRDHYGWKREEDPLRKLVGNIRF